MVKKRTIIAHSFGAHMYFLNRLQAKELVSQMDLCQIHVCEQIHAPPPDGDHGNVAIRFVAEAKDAVIANIKTMNWPCRLAALKS